MGGEDQSSFKMDESFKKAAINLFKEKVLMIVQRCQKGKGVLKTIPKSTDGIENRLLMITEEGPLSH